MSLLATDPTTAKMTAQQQHSRCYMRRMSKPRSHSVAFLCLAVERLLLRRFRPPTMPTRRMGPLMADARVEEGDPSFLLSGWRANTFFPNVLP